MVYSGCAQTLAREGKYRVNTFEGGSRHELCPSTYHSELNHIELV